jgi:hypothetical protein
LKIDLDYLISWDYIGFSKSKKNQLLDSLQGHDGIQLKKLLPLLEEWHETLNGGMGYKHVELIINVKEE